MQVLTDAQKDGLKELLKPFSGNDISKLPKPTKAQTDAVKANFQIGIRCSLCGGWHHKDVVHLDYVGHAALTARLLKVDPLYSWEPFAVNEFGLPAIDKDGGLWIKLTVCGVTRPGYGGADGKRGTDATKELIGDALRNAGMRFGMALDLWHKGDALFDGGDDSTDEGVNQETLTSDDIRGLNDKISSYNVDLPAFLKYMQVAKLEDLPLNKLAAAHAALDKKGQTK